MRELFSLKDVRIAYGKTEIIHGVDIDIAPGEFCALLGLNGSGKTTILHGCCGFYLYKAVLPWPIRTAAALTKRSVQGLCPSFRRYAAYREGVPRSKWC